MSKALGSRAVAHSERLAPGQSGVFGAGVVYQQSLWSLAEPLWEEWSQCQSATGLMGGYLRGTFSWSACASMIFLLPRVSFSLTVPSTCHRLTATWIHMKKLSSIRSLRHCWGAGGVKMVQPHGKPFGSSY